MKDDSDYTTLSMFIILGIVLIVTYYFCYKTSDKINYWTNNNKNILKHNEKYVHAYTFMIIISILAGLYLMYYLSFEIPNKTIFNIEYSKSKYIIHIGVLLLIGFSILWVPSIITKQSFVTNIGLFIAAIGAIILLASLISIENKNTKDSVAIAMITILVIQTFFLDFLIWTNLIRLTN